MNQAQEQAGSYFQTSGTLGTEVLSYVNRPADEQLFQLALAGSFSYVLTTRQMGKSSLMMRTAKRLEEEGIRIAIVDLSSIGVHLTRDQWYLGIVKELAQGLGLSVEPEDWWRRWAGLGPVQRFTDFVHSVVLAEIPDPARIVVFIDEIDSTLSLDFTDDFFAAVRHVYNARPTDPSYERLTFVLLGVAAPSDLIQDRKRTPFNIGQAVDLHEFERDGAQPLEDGLEQALPGQGGRILDRVFYWTGGHPYLTQKICAEIARMGGEWSQARIDGLVGTLFVSEEAKDENLNFVRCQVEDSPQRRSLLQLYRRVYEGEAVREDRRSSLHNRLKLIGLVRTLGSNLRVRNRIYERVFDLGWIKETMPCNLPQLVAIGGMVVSVLTILAAIFYVVIVIPVNTAEEGFGKSHKPYSQLYYLEKLCTMTLPQCGKAQDLFLELEPPAQRALFDPRHTQNPDLDLGSVVECLRPAIQDRVDQAGHFRDLAESMCWTWCHLDEADRGARLEEACDCAEAGGWE